MALGGSPAIGRSVRMRVEALMRGRFSIRALLWVLVLGCLLPGVIGGTLMAEREVSAGRHRFEQSTRFTARALAQAVDAHLLKAEAMAEILAGSDSLRERDFGRFHDRARMAVTDANLGSNAVLRDRDGRQVLNTLVPWGLPLVAAPAPEAVRRVFETGRPTVSDVFIGPVLGRPVMSVDVPVRIGDEIVYALGIGIEPPVFNALVAAHGLPQGWVAGIVDRSGTVFGRSHDAARAVGSKASPTFLRLMKQGDEAMGEALTMEGTEVLSFYSRSPATGWGVAIGVPRDIARAGWYRTAALLVAGTVTLLAIGLLLAWVVARWISGSFLALSRSADALGAGRPASVSGLHVREAEAASRAIDEAATLLAEREARLREQDRRKDEFIAVLAHELRNPLAPVRTAVEILARAPDDPARVMRMHALIDRQITHMSRLIDDLLDVSRIQRGTLALRRAPCDLSRVVSETADDYRANLEAAGLSMRVTMPDTPVWVDGDPVRLAQMVGNLLNNAGRFTDGGGTVDVRLSVDGTTGDSAAGTAGLARIAVTDSGVGLDPELLARLFDPFSQAAQDLARTKGGLGLGLALSRGLAQRHGGTIEARSAGPGQGATFTIELPTIAPPATDPAPDEVPAPARGLRVLVIEDNADTAASLAEWLELHGHRAWVAGDGASGLAMAGRCAPDVVISDIGLPGGLDGYGVARALAHRAPDGRPALIALSGYVDSASRRRASEAGFDAHLGKPPDTALLARLLARPPRQVTGSAAAAP